MVERVLVFQLITVFLMVTWLKLPLFLISKRRKGQTVRLDVRFLRYEDR